MLKPLLHYPEMVNPQLQPRYAGLATFFRTPWVENSTGIDIGVLGIPFDGGVTHRSGARHGPRAVREQSTLIRRYNAATGIGPFDSLKIADLGDAWVEKPYELSQALDEIQAFIHAVHMTDTVPLSIGGDHSVTLPILRALAAHRPVGLIHIDAHCDTGDDYLGSRFHHGATFRRAVEEGLVDPLRTMQIGIRGSLNHLDMWRFSHESGMRVVTVEEFFDRGWSAIADEACRLIGSTPVYLSFDIDGLDPVYAPGTGTPEAGGIGMHEAQRLLRSLSGLNWVGADVVEVAPPFDHAGITALNAATIAFEILCLLTVARQRHLQRGPQDTANWQLP